LERKLKTTVENKDLEQIINELEIILREGEI
jgi:hypothetical protein